MNPESRRVGRIKEAIKQTWPSSKFFKIHGNEFQELGIPDLLGCVEGVFVGLEVKEPDNDPDPIQIFRIMEIKKARGIAGVVVTSGEAITLISKGLHERLHPKNKNKIRG